MVSTLSNCDCCIGLHYTSMSRSAGFLNDLHSYDLSTYSWTQYFDTTPPSPRYRHGFAATSVGLFVFGGLGAGKCFSAEQSSYHLDVSYEELIVNASGLPLGDLHQFDFVHVRWTNLTNKVNGYTPRPRYGHGFASIDNSIFVHGGCTVAAG